MPALPWVQCRALEPQRKVAGDAARPHIEGAGAPWFQLYAIWFNRDLLGDTGIHHGRR